MKFTNESMVRNIITMRDLHEAGRLGYAIARNMRKMTDAAKEFIDIRDEAISRHGTDMGNGQYVVPQEKSAAFSQDIAQYADIEHDVDVFQVSEDEFLSGNLDSQQMFMLDWMVKPQEESI